MDYIVASSDPVETLGIDMVVQGDKEQGIEVKRVVTSGRGGVIFSIIASY